MNNNFSPLQDVSKVGGTSFYNNVVFATPNELKYILDEPAYEFNVGTDKINMEWYVQMPDGNAFTVYDYKEYKILHPNKTYEWHIGGHDQFTTHLAKVLLEEALQEAKDELRHSMNFKRAFARKGDY